MCVLVYDKRYAIDSVWWLSEELPPRTINLFFTHGVAWKLVHNHGITAHHSQTWAWMKLLKLQPAPLLSVAWVNGKSHIPTMTQRTIPSQSSVLHLKAYLTFHSSIHSPWAVRLWAWPRLAFGRQSSELKATHGPSLVLWVTKHTSRARNSWPVFLTQKEKLGVVDKYMAVDLV